jgi:hypothetical protein
MPPRKRGSRQRNEAGLLVRRRAEACPREGGGMSGTQQMGLFDRPAKVTDIIHKVVMNAIRALSMKGAS